MNRILRVWHIPQVPGKAFTVNVANYTEAKLVLDTLSQYDLFQYENRIKPDYASVGGLQAFDTIDGESNYFDWYPDEVEEKILEKIVGNEIIFLDDFDKLTLDRARAFDAALAAHERKLAWENNHEIS